MSKNPCGLDYCPYMDLVGEFANCTACSWAKALPSNVLANEQKELLASITQGNTKDCTKFLLWLLEEIMDEENWEMNAVADGEVIARKLTNLGLLEVKDGYYVRTSLTHGLQKEERESLIDKIKNWKKDNV